MCAGARGAESGVVGERSPYQEVRASLDGRDPTTAAVRHPRAWGRGIGHQASTADIRLISRKPASCSAAARSSITVAAGEASSLARNPGCTSSAKRAAPVGIDTTSNPVKRACAVAERASSAARSR